MKPTILLVLGFFLCVFGFLQSTVVGPTNEKEPVDNTESYFIGIDGHTPCKVCQVDCLEDPTILRNCQYRYYNYGCKRQSYCMTYKTGSYMEANAVTLFCTLFNGCTPVTRTFDHYKARTPGGLAHIFGLRDVTEKYRALLPLGSSNRTVFEKCRTSIEKLLMQNYDVVVPKETPECASYVQEVRKVRADYVVTLQNNYIHDFSFPREVLYKREALALTGVPGSFYYFFQLVQDMKDLTGGNLELLATEKGRKALFLRYKAKFDELNINVADDFSSRLPKWWWDLDHGKGVLPLNLNMMEGLYYQHRYEGQLRVDVVHDIIRKFVDSRLTLDAQYPVELIDHSYTKRKVLDMVRCPNCTVVVPQGEIPLTAAQKKLADQYVSKVKSIRGVVNQDKQQTLVAWKNAGADWCKTDAAVYFCYNNPSCPMLQSNGSTNEQCPRYKRRTTSYYRGRPDYSEWYEASTWKL